MIRKALSIITLILMLLPVAASAYRLDAKRGEVADGYNFWLYEPDSAAVAGPKPVIIFLHGASLCGNDLNRVRRYGTIDALERGRNIDAYVIAPQNPGGSWSPKRVMNVLDWVMERHSIDSSRVYVMGMSLGGYGTLDVAATYPDRVAAAMAFCGGATVKDLSGLNNLPLWIVHGTADRAVGVGQSDRVVDAMRKHDSETPRLRYDRVPGMNHSQPARFFYMQECYDWLFSHTLLDENRPLTDGFSINSLMLQSAYKGLKRNPNKAKASKSSKKMKKRSHARKSQRKRSNKVRR